MAERDEGKKEKGKKWDRKEKEKKKKLTSALSLSFCARINNPAGFTASKNKLPSPACPASLVRLSS